MTNNGMPETDDDLESVLNYKLKIEFDKLVEVLKQCRRCTRQNITDISLLNGVLNGIRGDCDSVKNQVQDCMMDLEKNSLTINRYNLKIMEIESMAKKGFGDIEKRDKLREQEMKQMVQAEINNSIGKLDEKMMLFLKRLEGVETIAENTVKHVEEKDKTDKEMESKLNKLSMTTTKDIDTLK